VIYSAQIRVGVANNGKGEVMAERVERKQTSLSSQDVMVRAVQYFTNTKWRTQTQSDRIATFVGRPPIPVLGILLTLVLIPTVIGAIIAYIAVVRRAMQLQNIVVTANPNNKGAEVVVTFPKHTRKMVGQFLMSLP
jgi:hypothetical protein